MGRSATGEPERAMADEVGSIDQDIRRDITNAIFDLRMPPGTHLSESRLGQLYKVSRTVVRKALFLLANDNLIELRPQRGAMVARPTARNAREVFEARRVIETALLEHSAPAMTRAKLRQLEQMARDGAAAYEAHDRQRMVRCSGDFHRLLAEMGDNAVLYEVLDRLIGRTSLVIAAFPARTEAACVPGDHARLIGLLGKRDVAGARELMHRHLLDCEAQLDLSQDSSRSTLAQMLAGARG